jgi:hypothetical protein
MSLTREAYQERKWGQFPILRKVLEAKEIPAHYFGVSSASDNMFDAMGRLLEIAVLVREFENQLKETALSLGPEKMQDDLRTLEQALERAQSFFGQSIHQVRTLSQSIRGTSTR